MATSASSGAAPAPAPARLSAWSKDLVAGTCSGMASIVVCHPLDTVRVRLQTTDASRFRGIADCVAQTLRHEGVLAFYKGMSTPFISQGMQKAVMFTSYGAARRALERHAPALTTPQPSLWLLYLSGGFAGFCNCIVATPIELIRSRLQVQYGRGTAQALYRGPIDCARKVVAQHGVRGLWSGFVPMVCRDVPGVAAWYSVFEGTRRVLVEGTAPGTPPPAWKLMLAGACGGVGYWVCAFPQDLIKSVVQTQTGAAAVAAATAATAATGATSTSASSGTASPSTLTQQPSRSVSFIAVGRELVQREGFARLWRGFPVALMRGIPGAAITFTTYQLVMREMNERGL